MGSLTEAQEKMINNHLIARGVKDERVLAAFKNVPRTEFVPDKLKSNAYADRPLPIGAGQTISQPYIVAQMVEALNPTAEDKVLEVGIGSGYAGAILAEIVGQVYGIEKEETLVNQTEKRLTDLAYENITLTVGDGTTGWQQHAPYDAILVSAAAPEIPNSLLAQLAIGGYLVLPVGTKNIQELYQVHKLRSGSVEKKKLNKVRFVPLIGTEGW